MAHTLLLISRMATPLELVYTYRHLMGRCDAGAGLDLDEIEVLMDIEARFAGWDASGKPFLAEARVDLGVRLRNERLNDEVALVSIGPCGGVCRQAPYADEGDVLEVVIGEPEDGASYRFKARVTWLRDDEDDDFALGLAFIGAPVLVRYAGRGGDEHRVPVAA